MVASIPSRVACRATAWAWLPADIVMPAHTPFVKVQRTQVLGAQVVLHGAGLAEASAEAHGWPTRAAPSCTPTTTRRWWPARAPWPWSCSRTTRSWTPWWCRPAAAGCWPGMAVVARALRPDMTIVGAQSDRWPSMLVATTGADLPIGGATLAEGIAVPVAGALTSRLVKDLVDEIVTVRDTSVEEAMNLLLDIEKVVAEGAGAAGIAALLEHPDRLRDREVGVVLTGGNVDPRLLASVIMRGLVRSGRLTRLQIEVPDVPGSLGLVTTTIGQAGANIVEIAHQRMFLDVSARSAELDVVIETYDHAHVERVIAALSDAGLSANVGEVNFGPTP